MLLANPVFNVHVRQRVTGDSDVPHHMVQAVRHDVATSAQQKAAKAVTAAKLKAVDGILWGQKPAKAPGEQDSQYLLASLHRISRAVSGVRIH